VNPPIISAPTSKVVTPSNIFKPRAITPKYKEESRSKSPLMEISPRPVAQPRKVSPIAVDGNEKAFPKPISVKDKSPGVPPRDLQKNNNQDRNIKRIRKGAPQVLGRQAANAAQQRPPSDLKKNPSVAAVVQSDNLEIGKELLNVKELTQSSW